MRSKRWKEVVCTSTTTVKKFFLIPKYNASFSSRLHDCIRVVVLMYLHMQILNIIPGDEVKLFLTKEHTHICYLLHFVHIINEEKEEHFLDFYLFMY